jgi:[glutamine synthetase] adenylyltransferase / [glutamine synthetase]-adenylyl-L-tyrosine phosphorylase
VLSHSRAHPALQDNVGNIALLQRAEDSGLLAPGVGREAADAYRVLRHAQHRARLDEASTQRELAELGELAPAREAVLRLWTAVFPRRA